MIAVLLKCCLLYELVLSTRLVRSLSWAFPLSMSSVGPAYISASGKPAFTPLHPATWRGQVCSHIHGNGQLTDFHLSSWLEYYANLTRCTQIPCHCTSLVTRPSFAFGLSLACVLCLCSPLSLSFQGTPRSWLIHLCFVSGQLGPWSLKTDVLLCPQTTSSWGRMGRKHRTRTRCQEWEHLAGEGPL